MSISMAPTPTGSMSDGTSSLPTMTTTTTSTGTALSFFISTSTPLLFTMTYPGACVFLLVTAVLHRVLLAVRNVVFATATGPGRRRGESQSDDDKVVDERRVGVVLGRVRSLGEARPLGVVREVGRGVFEGVLGAIAYVLIIAVTTLNTGYFLSVLSGIFLGTFLVGRFAAADFHY